MRISGTEPSPVILSQTKSFQKLESTVPKVSKQAEAKKDGVTTPHKITISVNLNTAPESTVELCHLVLK